MQIKMKIQIRIKKILHGSSLNRQPVPYRYINGSHMFGHVMSGRKEDFTESLFIPGYLILETSSWMYCTPPVLPVRHILAESRMLTRDVPWQSDFTGDLMELGLRNVIVGCPVFMKQCSGKERLPILPYRTENIFQLTLAKARNTVPVYTKQYVYRNK